MKRWANGDDDAITASGSCGFFVRRSVGGAERESFEQPVGNRRFSESIIQGDTSGEGSSNSAHPQTGLILGLKVSRIILPASQIKLTQAILTASFTNF